MDKKELLGVVERLEKELALVKQELQKKEVGVLKHGDYGYYGESLRIFLVIDGVLNAYDSQGKSQQPNALKAFKEDPGLYRIEGNLFEKLSK